MSENPKTITVVYDIVDYDEWRKTNPLHYEHNGLKAFCVSVGDQVERAQKLEEKIRQQDYSQ